LNAAVQGRYRASCARVDTRSAASEDGSRRSSWHEEHAMQTGPSTSLPGPVQAGSVAALWRSPVKSMMGEELNSCEVTGRGTLGREVALEEARPAGGSSGATAEEYWPDMAGLDYRDTVTDFEMPAGTFFDIAVVHLLTTATINHLRALYPRGRFEARRFRPNIVVSTGGEDTGFAENDWIGRTVAIGGNVRLAITEPCPRCVMVPLPQGDLPKDPGILRTAAQHNAVNVGGYSWVVSGGSHPLR